MSVIMGRTEKTVGPKHNDRMTGPVRYGKQEGHYEKNWKKSGSGTGFGGSIFGFRGLLPGSGRRDECAGRGSLKR